MDALKGLFGWQQEQQQQACYHVYGWLGCPYFQKAMCVGRELEAVNNVSVNVTISSRPTWREDVKSFAEKHKTDTNGHQSCPIIFEGCGSSANFVGGYTEFQEMANKRHKVKSTRC